VSSIPCPQAARSPGVAQLPLPPISNIVTDAPVIPLQFPVAQALPDSLVDQSITWPYHLPSFNGLDCLWWSMLVRSMYAADSTWLQRVAAWAGPVVRMQYVDRSQPARQGFGLVELGDSVLVVVPGTSSEVEALSYFLTHSLRLLTPTQAGWQINSTWAARGQQVLAAYNAWPPPSPEKPIIVVGHSSGGGYGAFVTYSLGLSGSPAVTLVTYGAPIWGTASMINAYHDAGDVPKTIDFVQPNDPVPLLPPPWAAVDLLLPGTYALTGRTNYFRVNSQLTLSSSGAPPSTGSTPALQTIAGAVIPLLTGGSLGEQHATRSYTSAADTWALNDPSIAANNLTPARRSLEAILADMNAANIG